MQRKIKTNVLVAEPIASGEATKTKEQGFNKKSSSTVTNFQADGKLSTDNLCKWFARHTPILANKRRLTITQEEEDQVSFTISLLPQDMQKIATAQEMGLDVEQYLADELEEPISDVIGEMAHIGDGERGHCGEDVS